MSTLNQRRLATARELAAKLVVASAMGDSPMLRGRTMTIPVRSGPTLNHIVPPLVSAAPALAPSANGGAAGFFQRPLLCLCEAPS